MTTIPFDQIIARGCGLDVHKKEVVATICVDGIVHPCRSFGSTTRSLTELKDWLLEHGITHVAMESTGVYWKPVLNVLESGGFTILVVNARHIKYVPGHKTDKKDSAWICKLLLAGLLKGSFIPDVKQRELRDLTRYRRKMIQQVSAEKNRMIRIFEDANLKLSSVFSDITGKTCTKVIDAILSGKTDPEFLVSLCTHGKLKSSRDDIRDAVEGRFSSHHHRMLQIIRSNIVHLERSIQELECSINEYMQPYCEIISRLVEIPGVGEASAKDLLAEIGVDMSVFPTERHISSWAGVCPGNNESGGKKKALEPRTEIK